MRYVFVHGLGQDSTSWEGTISFMEATTRVSSPNLFDLLQGEKPTYNNVYRAFSEYLEEFSDQSFL